MYAYSTILEAVMGCFDQKYQFQKMMNNDNEFSNAYSVKFPEIFS